MGALAMGRVNPAQFDGVTLDAYGTLVTLIDPVPALTAALAERDVPRDRDTVAHGFRVEVEHYVRHSASGHDQEGLTRLQRECARVFLDAVDADLDADAFAPVYAGAMHFEVLPGVGHVPMIDDPTRVARAILQTTWKLDVLETGGTGPMDGHEHVA